MVVFAAAVCALLCLSTACGNENSGKRVARTTAPAEAQAVGSAVAESRAPTSTIDAPSANTASPAPADVTTSTARAATATSKVVVAVTERDFAFDVQASVPAGEQTFVVTNVGAQAHEMIVARLNDGDFERARVAFTTPGGAPPPLTAVKSLGAMRPTTTGQVMLNLTPGTYALFCFLPDPTTGTLHVLLGMVAGLTVE